MDAALVAGDRDSIAAKEARFGPSGRDDLLHPTRTGASEVRMRLSFDSRVVLVTGAAQGIGRSIGCAFRESGAVVHLADIDGPGV